MPDSPPQSEQNTPEHFFKFSGAEAALKMLRYQSIFVTSPLDLNDPFEMRPAWTQEHEDRDREHENQRNRASEGVPICPVTDDNEIRSIGTMPAQPPQERILVDNQYGTADLHNEKVFRVMFEKNRILSFATEVCDVNSPHTESKPELTLMWSHYADMFQGACIVFDADKLPQGTRAGGYQMTYGEIRKTLPPDYYDTYHQKEHFEHGGISWTECAGIAVPKASETEIIRDRFLKILQAKSPVWEYENEWRLIYEMPDPSVSQCEFPCTACQERQKTAKECQTPYYRDIIKFPPEAVHSVLFGIDMPHADTQRLLEALSQDHYSHVKLYFSGIDSQKYAVKYTKQDADYIAGMQKIRSEKFNKAKGHTEVGPAGIGVARLKKGECRKFNNPL